MLEILVFFVNSTIKMLEFSGFFMNSTVTSKARLSFWPVAHRNRRIAGFSFEEIEGLLPGLVWNP